MFAALFQRIGYLVGQEHLKAQADYKFLEAAFSQSKGVLPFMQLLCY